MRSGQPTLKLGQVSLHENEVRLAYMKMRSDQVTYIYMTVQSGINVYPCIHASYGSCIFQILDKLDKTRKC